MEHTIQPNTSSLPVPSTEALQHSQQLIAYISAQIQKKGSISFEEYMHLSLYAPGLGYYHAGTHKLGLPGDFVTAPEMSPLFSYCLSNQCQDIFQQLSISNAPYSILEIGAGSGQMAVDILFQLSQNNSLPEYYYILELSPDLKQRQQQKLKTQCPDFFNRIQWLNALPNTPFAGIILANEVLDAMPIHVFKMIQGIPHEQRVICSKHPNIYFDYHYAPATPKLTRSFQHDLAEGYTSEINFNIQPWIQSLADCLAQGVILLIDYGFPRHEYYHPDRCMGTLMCHYQHRAHTAPFWHPGLQDITAHVDFTAVAEAASSAELEVLGYTSQAAFLLSCGLLDFCSTQDIHVHANQAQAINTLSSASEMGELFKVMALGKGINHALLGFQFSNRLGIL